MAIVFDSDAGTITGLSVGGLPDGTVDAGTLANNAVVTGKIADGTIANADINDLAASKLTGALPAISAANLTSIPAAEISGSMDYGYKNTPAFLAYTTNNGQNIPNATWTKVTHGNELFDSDNKFASGRFTPTVAGKYVLSGMIEYEQQDQDSATYLEIFKNGSTIAGGRWFNTHPDGGAGGANTSHYLSIVATSDTDDYFELYVYQNSGGRNITNSFGTYSSHFSGYKLAGA